MTSPGRGEAIRLLLEDNGLDYTEEDALPWDNWINNVKPKMAFGQLPCLDDGDFRLVQSNAILRYLGRKHGENTNTVIYLFYSPRILEQANKNISSHSHSCYLGQEHGNEIGIFED